MTKRLFQVLFLAVTLFATVQVSAQSFPSVAPPPGTTTYSSLPALPTLFPTPPFGSLTSSYSYDASGNLVLTITNTKFNTSQSSIINAGEVISTPSGDYTVAAAPTLPSGYSYTPDGQILTPSGATVSSFSVGGPTVPFDGGMSLVLLASGIGYASKRMKAKKAIAK